MITTNSSLSTSREHALTWTAHTDHHAVINQSTWCHLPSHQLGVCKTSSPKWAGLMAVTTFATLEAWMYHSQCCNLDYSSHFQRGFILFCSWFLIFRMLHSACECTLKIWFRNGQKVSLCRHSSVWLEHVSKLAFATRWPFIRQCPLAVSAKKDQPTEPSFLPLPIISSKPRAARGRTCVSVVRHTCAIACIATENF